eukprot:GEMP01037249.1.p1 GENE.GEMP01037249.1~~GEMP01037249.1.p1  ORF type:complete len:363 (-),score=52.70 GEMP01037249.1:794-1882(-)
MSPLSFCLSPDRSDSTTLCTDCGSDLHELVFRRGQIVRSRNQRPHPLTESDARVIVSEFYKALEKSVHDEQASYKRTNAEVPSTKVARWAKYSNADNLRKFYEESLNFLRANSEFRTKQLFSPQGLRFLVAVQHLVAADSAEMDCEPDERRHLDTFEGKSGCVNTQLVKDVHRSEWSIEGQGFSLQKATQMQARGIDNSPAEVTRDSVYFFQKQFVFQLEAYLLAFSERLRLSEHLTKVFMKVVTTQMSQCGLANLDQAGTASKYFVSGAGLDQRTVYNLSTFGQNSMKLSILCMKTSFSAYHTEQTLEGGDMSPHRCSRSSYLYQYATLQITPSMEQNKVIITVIDALDEAHIVPVDADTT